MNDAIYFYFMSSLAEGRLDSIERIVLICYLLKRYFTILSHVFGQYNSNKRTKANSDEDKRLGVLENYFYQTIECQLQQLKR